MIDTCLKSGYTEGKCSYSFNFFLIVTYFQEKEEERNYFRIILYNLNLLHVK